MTKANRYRTAKQGWYRLINAGKYRQPLDETMQSTKAGYVKYKSSLELHAIQYADAHPGVEWWSLEPFCLNYIKPTDGQVHRYYPDLLLSQGGKLILVEVKSSEEVKRPRPPLKQTERSLWQYNEALRTWYVNQAKWEAARKFCHEKNMHFCILTERDLK